MNARSTLRMLALSTAATIAMSPGTSWSQAPSPNVPVTERPRPEYDPLGVRAGTFLIFPSITVSETYNDNVFATPDDETDDFITLLQPRVALESNFPRHALGLTLGSDIALYASESDENFEDFFLTGNGRLDITRQSALRGDVIAGRFHQSRDDVEDEGGDELTNYYQYGGGLAFTQAFNRLNFRLSGRGVRTDYEDIDDRDQNDYDVLLRTGFLVSPRFNAFVEGRYNIQDRDVALDRGGFDRDSHGWEARVGTEVDITAVLFGEAFVGFRQQYFDDDAFDDADGISFGVDLTWNPTTLTTVGLSGGSDFEPTTQDAASANFRSAVELRVDHELLRNVIVGAFAGYERDEFEGIDRIDDTFNVGAQATYLLNRYLSVQGRYQFSDRSSDLDDEEFTRNLITIGLTAQL